tara:strand:+ start:349 stop:645 length:297 start_codon:yes stop_codon:yes gene_type:complete
MAAVPDFITGSKTSISTTAVKITSTSSYAKRGVQIVATLANTVPVYIGPEGVTAGTSAATTDGYPLQAGESIVIPVIDPTKIYAITASSTASISFLLV